MMKLKHLFDNRALVYMILENWSYDRSHPEVLDQFRISSNAVYPFVCKSGVCFLRFSPDEERNPDDIRAELDFLAYLRINGYPAAETVLSKKGRDLETIDTPWGTYSAVVFKAVPGMRLDQIPLADDIIFKAGASLGQLHRLSTNYDPAASRRPDWHQRLDWAKDILSAFPDETNAREEEALLRRQLSELPITSDTFGLIHYDFEPDNLFYDECGDSIHTIDFDDAVYHWYVMDIVQAVESLKEELPESTQEHTIQCFLDGYRSEKAIDESLLAPTPLFQRYTNLYSYVRILRVISGQLENEPEWMAGLRKHLDDLMICKKRLFGNVVGADDLGGP
jgi:Ser/Thr protein kinase RdoA (MazF antagonist)